MSRQDPEALIAWVRRNPPPSGDFCPGCLRAGFWHCSDPSRREDATGCRERIKAPSRFMLWIMGLFGR